MQQERGSIIESSEGTTLRYEGMIETRGADIPPVIQFAMDVGAHATAIAIATWVLERFRGREEKVSIDHTEVNLDDDGNVRQVIEDRIRIERP